MSSSGGSTGANQAVPTGTRARSARTGGVIGFILGVPWLSLSWLGHRWFGLTMPPFALFDMLARALPGGMVTTGLELMIRLLTAAGVGSTAEAAKFIEATLALLLALATMAGMGLLYGWVRHHQPYTSALPLGMSLGLAAVMLAWWDDWGSGGVLFGAFWALALGLAWGLTMDWVHRRLEAARQPDGTGRRAFLGRLAAAAGGFGLVTLLGARWFGQADKRVAELPFSPRRTPTPPPTADGFTLVAGTRNELTPIFDFFRVDINLRSPDARRVSEEARNQARQLATERGLDLPAGDYWLAIDGMVEQPVVVDLDHILQLERVDQFATLECISNPVGGDLIDTTWFSGARLAEVLKLAGLADGVADIVFHCADGYSESLPLQSALAEDTLLCYAMGGEPLSAEHGFPYRLYTRNRFGLKNPKWIIGIQAVAEDYRGYWQQRGWIESAWVQTEAVIDVVRRDDEGAVNAGGIAFAGDRGLSLVEVRVDEGEWIEAELNRPLSQLCWVQWSARLDLPSAGEYLFEVRATDGRGKVQTNEVSDQFPAGATGYHQKRVDLRG